MSLFKICPMWNTQCSDFSPNYDCYSLYCCRFGLDDHEKDYIVVGSHTGHLSIFKVNLEKLETGTTPEYRPIDVMLEINLPNPIIGIMTGKFLITRNEEQQQLALLHPMKLSIYSISIQEGVAEHGHQSKLNICYEHKLTKFAFSFCKGRFGNVKDKEFIMVSHMDGTLKFFEQDGISHECSWQHKNHRRNIPSVWRYIPRIDCFITISTAFELECFRYQDIIQFGENATAIESIWTSCIGEMALDFEVHQISNVESIIVILGEHNLFCVSDNGIVKFIKRLEYTPVCMVSFVIGWYFEPNTRIIIAIASDSGSFMIYEEKKMIWAAQLTEVPVAIQRSNIQGLPGAIITLGSTGQLQIGRLGVIPYVFKVPALNLHELNYEKAQSELIELEKEIKQGLDITEGITLMNNSAESDLVVTVTGTITNADDNGSQLQNCPYPTRIKKSNDEILKMCTVKVQLKATANLEQIQIIVQLPFPLKCMPNSIYLIQNLETNQHQHISVHIFMEESINIPTIEIQLIISFINNKSLPRILEKKIRLPLTLFFRNDVPQKEAIHKFSISLENISELPNLFKLFQFEYNNFDSISGSGSSSSSSGTAIGFKSLYTDANVTIVAAKSSNRYRIQSNDLESIPVIFEVLINRLLQSDMMTGSKYMKSSQAPQKSQNLNKNIKINIQPEFPIDNILQNIDNHYEAYENVNKTRHQLDMITKQMRLIQRRLYVKLEDKSMNALNGINLLFNDTYRRITNTLQTLKVQRDLLLRAQTNLSCTMALLQIILKYLNLPTSKQSKEELTSVLIQPVIDWSYDCWENTIAAPLNMINSIGPFRKNKNTSLDDHPTFSVKTFDIHQFKKQLKSLLERIGRLLMATSTELSSDVDHINNNNNNNNQISKTSSDTIDDISNKNEKNENNNDEEDNENDDDDDDEDCNESNDVINENYMEELSEWLNSTNQPNNFTHSPTTDNI